MKIFSTILMAGLVAVNTFAQVEVGQETQKDPDTTRTALGNTEIIFISHDEDEYFIDNEGDTVYQYRKEKKKSEAHWAGVDFGFTMLMNSSFDNNFPNNPEWNNDPAKSQTWNLNLFEHKFNIAREYFGITTGLGFSFTSIAFKNNYIIDDFDGALTAQIDTINNYKKNKLKAAYLTVPFLLEFNTNADASKSFYLAAGVVGGVRLSSKVKRKGTYLDANGYSQEFELKEKGRYGLNAFKLDAAVRLGYSNWGVFASYSLLPLFEQNYTAEIYPLTFGLSLNF